MKQKGKIFLALLAVALLVCIATVTLAACDGDKNNGVTSNGGNSGTPSGDISGGIWDIIPREDVEIGMNFVSLANEYDRTMYIEYSEYVGYRYISLSEGSEPNGSSVIFKNQLFIEYFESEEEAKKYVDNYNSDHDYDYVFDEYDYDYVFYEGNKVFYGDGNKDFYKNTVLASTDKTSQISQTQRDQIDTMFKETADAKLSVWQFQKDKGVSAYATQFRKRNSNCIEEIGCYSISDSENQEEWDETRKYLEEEVKSKIGTEYTDDSYVNVDDEKGEIYYRYKVKPGFRFEDIKDKNGEPTGEARISAFYYDNANNLSVVIPSVTPEGKPVTSIGNWAFEYCSGLTEITIPASVTSISRGAFEYCCDLEKIEVEQGNPTYKSDGNCLIEKSSNTLILGCKNSVIPNYVQSIGSGAFKGCTGLTEITIPDSVKSIGNNAFEGCTGLTEITIPNSVTYIGTFAFSDCPYLQKVTIGESVTKIDSYAFEDCTNLQTVYYEGTSEQWKGISIDNSGNSWFINAKRYYFSADDPYEKGTAKEGEEYWHWNEDKTQPVVWEKHD